MCLHMHLRNLYTSSLVGLVMIAFFISGFAGDLSSSKMASPQKYLRFGCARSLTPIFGSSTICETMSVETAPVSFSRSGDKSV